jgi:2',3'-cyclic-nucleotide 2'-phosphodiesterase/3'-nucleotidase
MDKYLLPIILNNTEEFMKKINRTIIFLTVLLSLALVGCKTKAPVAQEGMQVVKTTVQETVGTEVTMDTTSTADEVNILYFNDFHGNVAEDVSDWGKNIGMAKMVSYANDAKSTLSNTFVVSGGDNYQGTAVSNLTYGAPVSTMFKSLNVPFSSVGNHEFDWGVKHITTWQEDGGFTFLAANIVDEETRKPVSWAKPYGFVNIGQYKIAFVGLAHPNTSTLTSAANVEGLEFTDPALACQEWVNYLREGHAEEGTPDAIIALTHIDSAQNRDTGEITGNVCDLTTVDGLDAILSAHSHQTVSGTVNGMPIIQAYKYGRSIGRLTIKFNADKSIESITPMVDPVYKIKSNIIPDEKSEESLAVVEAETVEITGEVLGTAAAQFTHDRSTNNVTKLGYWFCKLQAEEFGTQVAINNGGGFRRSLEKGTVTMGDAYEIMPFDNYVITFDLPGSDLKAAIDHGIENPEITDGAFYGVIVEYDPTAEFEHRITSITINDGTPVEDDTLYSVSCNNFMFTGGDSYNFKNATNVVETYIPLRDIMVDAFKTQGVIAPLDVNCITAK